MGLHRDQCPYAQEIHLLPIANEYLDLAPRSLFHLMDHFGLILNLKAHSLQVIQALVRPVVEVLLLEEIPHHRHHQYRLPEFLEVEGFPCLCTTPLPRAKASPKMFEWNDFRGLVYEVRESSDLLLHFFCHLAGAGAPAASLVAPAAADGQPIPAPDKF